jgi:hypothetical protein
MPHHVPQPELLHLLQQTRQGDLQHQQASQKLNQRDLLRLEPQQVSRGHPPQGQGDLHVQEEREAEEDKTIVSLVCAFSMKVE